MSRNKKIEVIVNNKTFDSMYSAATFLGADVSCVAWALKHNRDRKYKGIPVSFADAKLEQETIEALKNKHPRKRVAKKTSLKACPVEAKTLDGKVFSFKTITDAAKYAKVNGWTMSMKMQACGQFTDKNGVVYKRLKPMNTKNQYTTPTDTITKTIVKYKKHSVKSVKENVVDVPVSAETKSAIQVAKDALKEKILGYIQEDNFKMAKELLDVVEQIKGSIK